MKKQASDGTLKKLFLLILATCVFAGFLKLLPPSPGQPAAEPIAAAIAAPTPVTPNEPSPPSASRQAAPSAAVVAPSPDPTLAYGRYALMATTQVLHVAQDVLAGKSAVPDDIDQLLAALHQPNVSQLPEATDVTNALAELRERLLLYGRYANMTATQLVHAARGALSAKLPLPDEEEEQLLGALNQPGMAKLPETENAAKALAALRVQQAAASMLAARGAFASTMDTNLLNEDIDATVKTSGPNRTTLTVTYVLMTRLWAYKLVNAGDFWQVVTNLGFKHLIFSDGYDGTWTYDVDK